MKWHALFLTATALITTLNADEEFPFIDEPLAQDEVAFLENDFLTQAPPSQAETIDLSEAPILKARKSAFLAGTLSSLLPGLGHAYLGEYGRAGGYFGAPVVFAGLGASKLEKGELDPWSFVLAQNSSFYSAYAAYRDARAYNDFSGYSYEMPVHSLGELVFAPFQWGVLKKPTVWGGYLGALALGALTVMISSDAPASLSTEGLASPLIAFPVAIGEEAYYRGFIQSALIENYTPTAAILTSSLLFGAAHLGNAQAFSGKERQNYYRYSIPLITTLGVYFGWMTHRSGSLKEAVALHAWYDFTLFALGAIAESAAVGRPSFHFSFSF